MTVYLLASFFSVVFASFSRNYNRVSSANENKNKRFSFSMVISLFFMFVVSAFRYNVGTDYSNYVAGFYRTYSSGHYEIIFVLLQNFIKIFTNDYQWLFIITSLIFIYFAYKAIYDQSRNYGLSVFLLILGTYYFQSLNHVRFMIAVAIFMYSIKFVTLRKFKLFLVSILFAAGFHRIFILLIPIYWIYSNKVKIRHIILGAIILAIALWNLDVILSRINVFEVYSIYLQTEKHAAQTLWGLLLMNGVVLAFYSLYWKKGKGSLLYRFYFNMQLISFLLSIMSGMIPLAGRLVVIFRIIQVFGIPFVIKMEKSKYMRWILTAVVGLSFILYSYYAIYLMNGHGVLPYQIIK